MKHFKSLFQKNALQDLEEARRWYDLQQKGLGKMLVSDLKATSASIKQNPYFASVKFDNIRNRIGRQ